MSLNLIQNDIRQSFNENFQQWTVLKPAIVVRDLVGDWLGVMLALLVCAYLQTWWAYLAAFAFIGIRQYALFLLGHDGMHGSLHTNPKINDWVTRWLIFGPMFMGLEDGRRNHLQHHKLLGCDEDPDRYLHTFAKKDTPWRLFLFMIGLATFGKTVLKVTPFHALLSAKDKSQEQTSKANTLSKFAANRIPVAVAQSIIITVFCLLKLPIWSYPLLWIAPIYFFVFVPDEIRAFCEHAVPNEEERAADEQRLITFLPNWLEAAYFSPHNMNYHAEHHLWPRVPYYSLPQVRETLKHRQEITIKLSYVSFLGEVFRHLFQMQKARKNASSR